MATLGEIRSIRDKIKSAPAKTAKTLYRVIFNEEVRLNRARILAFSGFEFEIGSDDFIMKVQEVCIGFSIADLTAVCVILGISYDGNEEEITTRICTGLCDFAQLTNRADEEEEEDDEQNEEQNENIIEEVERVQQPPPEQIQATPRDTHDSSNSRNEGTVMPKFAMTFRDLEDSLRMFSGDSVMPIGTWISDFEELAVLVGWTDLQKLVFAKKSLTGLAKLYVQGQGGITTWTELKKRLMAEFAMKINSAELHQALAIRRMRKDESYQEYLLKMRELASRGRIEEESVIQYVIAGIADDVEHKMSLYEAATYDELKRKLLIYEKVRNNLLELR